MTLLLYPLWGPLTSQGVSYLDLKSLGPGGWTYLLLSISPTNLFNLRNSNILSNLHLKLGELFNSSSSSPLLFSSLLSSKTSPQSCRLWPWNDSSQITLQLQVHQLLSLLIKPFPYDILIKTKVSRRKFWIRKHLMLLRGSSLGQRRKCEWEDQFQERVISKKTLFNGSLLCSLRFLLNSELASYQFLFDLSVFDFELKRNLLLFSRTARGSDHFSSATWIAIYLSLKSKTKERESVRKKRAIPWKMKCAVI